MALDDFKGIYWFEYSHRLLGRLIGVIFLLPMIYFFMKGSVSKLLQPKLLTMFLLGGLQGLLGWYMVKSGLVNDPHVSQYRLTAHLGMAFVIYAFIFWTALGLVFPKRLFHSHDQISFLMRYAYAIPTIVFITVLSGGFVAGLKAGFIYNTFPLMDGKLIPDGIFALDPLWRNLFENIITVQFDHRVLATIVVITITSFFMVSRKHQVSERARWAIKLLFAALVLQVTLGISTLLLEVPVSLAAAHQAGALLLFTASLFTLHSLKNG
jgi:cytochrome c oxidase assembly protein subunit 15